MKFIVDAQLPRKLAVFLNSEGHNAIHTLYLPLKNATVDHWILEVAKKESRVVISKDNDFLESYIMQGKPDKLLFVSTGNIPNAQLINLFEKNLTTIIKLFDEHKVIELNRISIIVHF